MKANKQNKAVFLDRDGTINVDKNYLSNPDEFEFLPRAVEGLKLLTETSFKLIIVTNQSGIGRGLYTTEDYMAVNTHMLKQLQKQAVEINEVYYCPHSPEDACDCRKPATGMIDRAVQDFNINPRDSWVVGDKLSDIELGRRAGCRTILVETGSPDKDRMYNPNPTHNQANPNPTNPNQARTQTPNQTKPYQTLLDLYSAAIFILPYERTGLGRRTTPTWEE